MNIDIIKKLIDSTTVGNSEELKERISDSEAVIKKIALLNTRVKLTMDEFEDSMTLLNLDLKNVQEFCPHYAKTYSRPTAECTPVTTCDICGLEL